MKNKVIRVIIFLIAISLVVYNLLAKDGAISLIKNEQTISQKEEKTSVIKAKSSEELVDNVKSKFIETTKNNLFSISGIIICGIILFVMKKKRKKEEEEFNIKKDIE